MLTWWLLAAICPLGLLAKILRTPKKIQGWAPLPPAQRTSSAWPILLAPRAHFKLSAVPTWGVGYFDG